MEQERIGKIESLIEMEKIHASSLEKSVSNIRNAVIKEILAGIAFDSEKHANFYLTILNLLVKIEPAISEKDFEDDNLAG